MRKLWTSLLTFAAVAVLNAAQAPAPTGTFTLDRVLDYPFPDNLIAAPKGSTIAWTFNEHGARNIYVADGPEFQARRVTAYAGDDGQELTSLSFAPAAHIDEGLAVGTVTTATGAFFEKQFRTRD